MIFAHLASKWIVEGRGTALRDLLQSLDREEITKEIENWDSEGSVLIDYFEVIHSKFSDLVPKEIADENDPSLQRPDQVTTRF